MPLIPVVLTGTALGIAYIPRQSSERKDILIEQFDFDDEQLEDTTDIVLESDRGFRQDPSTPVTPRPGTPLVFDEAVSHHNRVAPVSSDEATDYKFATTALSSLRHSSDARVRQWTEPLLFLFLTAVSFQLEPYSKHQSTPPTFHRYAICPPHRTVAEGSGFSGKLVRSWVPSTRLDLDPELWRLEWPEYVEKRQRIEFFGRCKTV
jgi:hypothetical protein